MPLSAIPRRAAHGAQTWPAQTCAGNPDPNAPSIVRWIEWVRDTGDRSRIAEAARILKTSARFVFTDWERDLSPPGYPAPVNDYRPLLEATGFALERHQFWPHQDAMHRVFYEKMLLRQEELIRELDGKTAESNLREARAWLGLLDGVDYMQHSRRVLAAARRMGEK